MNSAPSDNHNIPDHEDLAHEPTPDCPCKPRLIGIFGDGRRLWEHNELLLLN